MKKAIELFNAYKAAYLNCEDDSTLKTNYDAFKSHCASIGVDSVKLAKDLI